ncbi:MAG TPA: hypothetical protein PK803_05645 [Alphaproteobacteria bacterium]|nr:hypothetical protein [Alphaproteobacteria bacterium]
MVIKNEFSRLLALDQLHQKPMERTIKANSDEMNLLAKRFDLFKISKLEAKLSVGYTAQRDLEIKGHLVADFQQKNVKTLQPIAKAVNKEFVFTFVKETDNTIDNIAEDSLELLNNWVIDGELDIGEIVVQEFSDEVDLYPGIED